MLNFKKIGIFIAIPLAAGGIGTLLGNSKQFASVIKPSFDPPGIVFPIVWTILYILMGISAYLVYESKSEYKSKALVIFAIQLFINSIWNLFFFRLKMFLLSFILVLSLIIINLIMILYFLRCNKLAGYLQIPYICWLTFASVLTYSIYILN